MLLLQEQLTQHEWAALGRLAAHPEFSAFAKFLENEYSKAGNYFLSTPFATEFERGEAAGLLATYKYIVLFMRDQAKKHLAKSPEAQMSSGVLPGEEQPKFPSYAQILIPKQQ